MNNKISPNDASGETVLLERVSKTAPQVPKINPPTLEIVKGSFNQMNAITATKMGLAVMMIAALILDDKFNPWKKNNWLIATPNTPHKAVKPKSFPRIFSEGRKLLTNQNKLVAPATLKKMNTLGVR